MIRLLPRFVAALLAATLTCAFAQIKTTGPTQVQVMNTVQQPVPVRDASSQVWRRSGTATLTVGGNDFYIVAPFTVPQGKRLVIEQVSMNCSIFSTSLQLGIMILPQGDAVQAVYFHLFAPADLGYGRYAGATTAQIAADAGDVVYLNPRRTGAVSAGQCWPAASGRLIDVQY